MNKKIKEQTSHSGFTEKQIARSIKKVLFKNIPKQAYIPDFIDGLTFEITNEFHSNAFFSYSVRHEIDISEIEFHLFLMGIQRTFIDKTDAMGVRKYLVVYR